ncbi:MAG: hypothetical protein LH613_11855 [Chamaesiphon sp.]|nr:hypothetical protein [Chamaesiphon sp.]
MLSRTRLEWDFDIPSQSGQFIDYPYWHLAIDFSPGCQHWLVSGSLRRSGSNHYNNERAICDKYRCSAICGN